MRRFKSRAGRLAAMRTKIHVALDTFLDHETYWDVKSRFNLWKAVYDLTEEFVQLKKGASHGNEEKP